MSLYDDLGVTPNATPDEVKRAYRALAQKHHPDKDGGNADAFQKVQSAYDVIGDAERRARYDATGETGSGRSREQVLREIAARAVAETMVALMSPPKVSSFLMGDSVDRLSQVNIPGQARDTLLQQMASLFDDASGVETDIERLKRCLDRADKDSITADVIISAISNATMLAANIRSRIADISEAANLLDAKQYRHDPPSEDEKLREDTLKFIAWRG